jgi:hypothetical protein
LGRYHLNRALKIQHNASFGVTQPSHSDLADPVIAHRDGLHVSLGCFGCVQTCEIEVNSARIFDFFGVQLVLARGLDRYASGVSERPKPDCFYPGRARMVTLRLNKRRDEDDSERGN